MFSGIVQKLGEVHDVNRKDDGSGRMQIHCDLWPEPLVPGESIANNGVCLTLTSIQDRTLSFDILDETFNKTNLGTLKRGDLVNLERALRVGDVIGGHFVTGHVDGTGITSGWEQQGRDYIWRIESSSTMTRGMVPKGSVTCDGISLTIVDLTDHGFSVHIIPHTVENTNLKRAKIGTMVNLETDMLGKYVARSIEALNLRK